MRTPLDEVIARLSALERWRERQETLEPRRTWLFSQTASVTVANTAAETTLVGSGVGSRDFPANFFVPGRAVRVTAQGSFGYTATPTILLRVYLGSVNLAGTGAMTLTGAVALTNWKFDGLYICRTTGATGTIAGSTLGQWLEPTNGNSQHSGGTNTGAVFDSTVAASLDFRVLWGAANALNTITCNNLVVEALN